MFWAFLVASVGCTHIVVDAAFPPIVWMRSWIAAKGPDWLQKLITCYQCSGMWVGMFLGLLVLPFQAELYWWVQMLVCGFACSYASMAAAALINYLDRPWNNNDTKA